MRDAKEFVESIPLSECRVGDRLWLRSQPGQPVYGHHTLVKIKPLAAGKVQIKYVNTWSSARKTAKVLKADMPGDMIVERRPPAADQRDVTIAGSASTVEILDPETVGRRDEDLDDMIHDVAYVLTRC